MLGRGFHMRKVPVLCAVCLLVFGCSSTAVVTKPAGELAAAAYHPTGPKKRVAVAEFENRTPYGQRRLGAGISDILATELSRTGAFILVEREQLDAVMREQALGLSGMVSEKSAPQVGQLIGANAVITGAVTQFGVRTEAKDLILTASKKQIASCVVDVRLVEVSTGRIIWAGSGSGSAERKYTNYLGSGSAGSYDEMLESDAFRSAAADVMQNLLNGFDRLEWSCLVAKVDIEKIYLNAGRNSGLEIGATPSIYRLGEPVLDPVTGAEIGREETEIGIGQVIGYLGDDGSIMTLTEGRQVKVGDICRLK
jgi:curli biogenesis system outer membrane secretion channel CsgG